MHDYLTIADIVAMPHLGLELVAGADGVGRSVLWTHTSELADPGPWLEGGELLIVNGFGIPQEPAAQVDYIERLAHHRLAGLAVSVKAPELSASLFEAADRLSFPVLRVPKQVPFIELSYLVANASDRSVRGRLARHLRVFDTLRFRSSAEGNVVGFYQQLEEASGYRLALVSPAGTPLLREWTWVPEGLDLTAIDSETGTQIIEGGYVIPLTVGDRVTAYLIGKEHDAAAPAGLAGLQHVSTLAALDAVDDQRRREMLHRQGSALLTDALDGVDGSGETSARFVTMGLDPAEGLRFVAFGAAGRDEMSEITIRDWLADREIPHLLMLTADSLFAVLRLPVPEVLEVAVTDLGVRVGVSPRFLDLAELPRMRRMAGWSLSLAGEASSEGVVLAEQQIGLGRWLNPDVETIKLLADSVLHPLVVHDREQNSDLVNTLTVYFHNRGSLRKAAAQLFVHEHTLTHRLKSIERLTARSLKDYREKFELWLAIEARALVDEI
ncbi:PucR family transcriptional regulator ligand-binding domain-containing protein [uncultured Microbacterium sp.]|uniref:PucR family transcriptional regulator n=1 Tax=uncultured Microbacterium sp. TaxID=191216 RepID=UPI0028E40CE6|nr:PucR family transcriptional regulator ligand-binding domain-containing protein [uncultured Microbacterium sp.]